MAACVVVRRRWTSVRNPVASGALRCRFLSSAAASTSCADHPLVDVAGLQQLPGSAARATAVASLRSALLTRGYFYASNVDALPISYIRRIYEYSQRVHALPVHVKQRYAQRGGTGAYSGLDIGQSELNYDASESVAAVSGWDYSRQPFSLGDAATPPDERYPGAAEGLEPPFAAVLDDLYSRQTALGRVLLTGFEEALALPPRTLLDLYEGADGAAGDFGTIRLLSYPGGDDAAAARATTGIAAHTDFEGFTLMHQSAPGLQLMPRDAASGGHGEWVDAPVRDAEFVVILGDMLERLTNGVLRATPHRVLQRAHARSSIIRFNGFAPEALIQPLPPFVTRARPAAYSPVTMRTHSETTMRNLEAGRGSWDLARARSTSATYDYT